MQGKAALVPKFGDRFQTAREAHRRQPSRPATLFNSAGFPAQLRASGPGFMVEVSGAERREAGEIFGAITQV